MAPDGHTAQVHPYLFTTSMLSLAQERGVVFIPGKVASIEQSAQQVQGVTYVSLVEPEKGLITLPATHVIVCAGAWSPSLVRNLDITTTRAHSITIHPAAGVTISPYVLFTEIEGLGQNRRQRASPEVYARPDNEIYVCGPGDDMPLPPTVDDVPVDDKAIDAIIEQAGSISQQMREGTVDKKQACYLPLGGPLIGEARKQARGLYIATGHTCWVRVDIC
jgi:glycine/D-amino acid oxidase-like deaminating enzyme